MLCNQQLVVYEVRGFQSAGSPFHMEVMALLMAMEQAVLRRIGECQFLRDSKLLVDTFNPKTNQKAIQVVDWRCYAELNRIALILKSHPKYCCRLIPREVNTQAHLLANRARVGQFNYTGFTLPSFSDCCSF